MESLSSLGNETNLVIKTTPAWTFPIRNNVRAPETPTGSCTSSTSGWERNSTEDTTSPAPPPHPSGLVPVIGYPGPLFTAIHASALTSLSLSIVVVITLFIYLCGLSGSVKDQRRGTEVNGKRTVSKLEEGDSVANSYTSAQTKKTRLSFWKWNVGERLVIYLAISDLCQGTSHILDHAYMLYEKDNPPDLICAVFAFFLHNFVLAQWMVVVASAISACSLVVFGRKMSLGRYDWRLFVFAFGIPTLISVTALSFGLLGASGAWCFIKYGAPFWFLYTQFVSTFQISTYFLVGLAYGAIWIKIQSMSKLMKGSTTARYQNSAKVMMIFVAAFILQWWTYTLFNIWSIFANPPPPVLILAVIFINLGGVYNAIAYMFIRRKLQNQKRQNAVVSNHDNITNSTAAKSSDATPRTVSAPRAVNVPGGSRVQEVRYIPPKVLDFPGVAPQVTQAGNVPELPIVQDVLQTAHVVSDYQRAGSDASETQDVGAIQIRIHI